MLIAFGNYPGGTTGNVGYLSLIFSTLLMTWPKINTLFMTVVARIVALNIKGVC